MWIADLATGSGTLLGQGMYPVWTPDGATVTFAQLPPTGTGIFRRRADAGAPEELVTEGNLTSISWAPDGLRLAVTTYPGNPDVAPVRGDRNVAVLLQDGSVELLTSSEANERGARFSPDGRWIAYVSDESGRDEVYGLPYPGPGPRTIVSNAGGDQPVWSADGRELHYLQADPPGLMAVPIRTTPGFEAGTPVRPFGGRFHIDNQGVGVANYDIHTDGRFLMNVPAVAPGINVVTNWLPALALAP